MTLALLHLAPREDPWATLRAVRAYALEAQARGASLLLLPELLFGKTPVLGLEEALKELAAEAGLLLLAGYMAEEGRRRKNRLAAFPEGPSYDKVHPYLAEGEEGDEGVAPGEGPVLLRAGMVFGLALCYDLDFPELFRAYALGGAEGFLVGAAWPGAYRELMTVLARARAAENQAYLLLASREDTGSPSLAVGPDGRLLGVREEEGLLLFSPDLEFQRAYRAKYPLLRHRREEAYRVR
ncbi:putative amidohydrolase [Thermus oshimai JL-2]|uniref:Putative amidohydrolase n=1 Tax=Thermus oshimai JL-2 TaxID=751945 RepID=K7RHT9_THEOS|nr:carbon-nitrogen hydrolase family protein [Thermus oshimai]AFV75972.1 putative amidohydrolase [Thermus oshimai JL-2]